MPGLEVQTGARTLQTIPLQPALPLSGPVGATEETSRMQKEDKEPLGLFLSVFLALALLPAAAIDSMFFPHS